MSQQQNCKSTVERALELAGSGDVASLSELAGVLNEEGYSSNMLAGPVLLKQIRERIVASRNAL